MVEGGDNRPEPRGMSAEEKAKAAMEKNRDHFRRAGKMGDFYTAHPAEAPVGYWDREERKAKAVPKQTAPANEHPPHLPNPWTEPKPETGRDGRGGR